MMDQVVSPCGAASVLIELIKTSGIVLTTFLTAFLATRRVRKDRLDARRWSTCPLLDVERPSVGHRHRKGGAMLNQ